MTSHRITFEQAVILLIGVGVMLMVEPVCRGIVFGRLPAAPGLSPYQAEPDSRLGADALQSPIAENN